MNAGRLARFKQQILAHGMDGIVLMPGNTMKYISNLNAHMSERPILLFIPADDDPAIIIPQLEASKAEMAGIAADRIFSWSDQDGFTGAFQAAAVELELNDYLLGIEAYQMRVIELETLQRYAPDMRTAHAEDVILSVRGVKDSDEVAKMQKAAHIAEKAMRALLPTIKVGQTEHEIAARLAQELSKAGAQGVPFGPIVAGGPNGALPHATLTDRPLQNGDLLIIDWGANFEGYCSDITRTYAIGEIEPEFERIYNAVRLSNEAGRSASQPGATGEEIDRASRDVIDEIGYGEYFIHRTGHGLGMEAHEPPSIVEGNVTPMSPGNVFTVEPGIYLPGRAGVRIEDDIVITEDGHLCLTSLPRELTHIG